MASPRMLLKVAQIARMRVAGVKDVAIARALNITNSGLTAHFADAGLSRI